MFSFLLQSETRQTNGVQAHRITKTRRADESVGPAIPSAASMGRINMRQRNSAGGHRKPGFSSAAMARAEDQLSWASSGRALEDR
jgi:hypothetical protein